MKSNVKALYSDPPEGASTNSPPLSPFSSSARMPDQASTLLVVENDRVFREFEARTLTDGGYTVLKATGVAEAMLVARSAPIIHLLLTDSSVCGLDGLEFTKRFRALRPETPVLMLTGSLPLPSHRTEKMERFGVLGRPFDVNELLHRVRSLLDAVVPRIVAFESAPE